MRLIDSLSLKKTKIFLRIQMIMEEECNIIVSSYKSRMESKKKEKQTKNKRKKKKNKRKTKEKLKKIISLQC